MIPPARALASSSRPLLRRWRAWQIERATATQQQPQLQQARLVATTPATGDESAPPPAPPGSARITHADVVASVARALERRLGVRPGLECEVCDGLLSVDIALHLESPSARRVAVDVTPRPGSAHTPQRAWALAQARRQALKAHGWHYVQLPAVEFLGAMGDAEEEDELLRRSVLALPEPEGGGGGGAHVCGSGCAH